MTEQDRWTAIMRRINTIANRNWTDQTFIVALNQQASDFTACVQCGNGFFPFNNTFCQRCPPNCVDCITSTCSVCANGFFLNGSSIC